MLFFTAVALPFDFNSYALRMTWTQTDDSNLQH